MTGPDDMAAPRDLGALRDALAAAAAARRCGDHGAADLLEADAVILLRALLRPVTL